MTDCEFMERWQEVLPRLRSVLRGPRYDCKCADDILQDTWLRAWTRREQLRDPAHFATWCFRIMSNAFHSFLRKPDQERQIQASDEMWLRFAEPPVQIEMQMDLSSAIKRLPPNIVELMLRHMDGESYIDMAAELGQSPVTVKVAIHRARKKAERYVPRSSTGPRSAIRNRRK